MGANCCVQTRDKECFSINQFKLPIINYSPNITPIMNLKNLKKRTKSETMTKNHYGNTPSNMQLITNFEYLWQ